MSRGRTVLVAGVALAGVFFALAPRSPITAALGGSRLLGLADSLAGLAAFILVVAGYVLYEFERLPRLLARVRVASFGVLLAWGIAGMLAKEALFSRWSLAGVLAGLAIASPIAVLGYVVVVRPLERKMRRVAGFVLVMQPRNPRHGEGED